MRSLTRALLSLALTSQGACTLVGTAAAATAVATHNSATNDHDDWHYAAPMLVCAAIGLVVDVTYALAISKLATP